MAIHIENSNKKYIDEQILSCKTYIDEKDSVTVKHEDISNENNVTVENKVMDARQANPNIDGTLAKNISIINNDIGDVNILKTTSKILANAINEVFQSGNEKKQQLVTNLIAMGVTCNINESWESLLAKVLTIFTGTDVSDTTAVAAHVLETDYFYNASGIRTKGSMIDRDGYASCEGVWKDSASFYAAFPKGAYLKSAPGDINPQISIPFTTIANELGITADKILEGNTICGINGTVVSKEYASGGNT